MLQKLSCKTNIAVVQVRTPDELAQCDALIIPGGGASLFFSHADLTSLDGRVDHHRIARADIGPPGAAEGLRAHPGGVGDVCGRDHAFAGSHKREERRAGVAWWYFCRHSEEWVGIAGSQLAYGFTLPG